MGARHDRFERNEREERYCRRVLRLRRERRRKCLNTMGMISAVLCMVMICTVSYDSIKSKANSSFKYYTSVTVGAGESLWELADDFIDYDYYKNKNAYISEVQRINHLEDEGSITAGQVLILPYYSTEFVY